MTVRSAYFISALSMLIALWLLAPAAAGADAVLVASSPGGQATVGGEVREVQIVFNELVAEGNIEIDGPSGALIVLDQTRTGQVLSARFGPLTTEGRYSVRYSLISADSDPVSGTFVFEYLVGGPPQLPVAVPVIATGASPLLVGVVVIAIAGLVMLAGQTFLRTQQVRKLSTSDGLPSDG